LENLIFKTLSFTQLHEKEHILSNNIFKY